MAYFSQKLNSLRKIPLLAWFFPILIFLLPLQTRLVLFLPESHIDQSFIFYNSLFLYLTDIVLVIMIFFWLIIGLFHEKQRSNDNVSGETYKESKLSGKLWLFHGKQANYIWLLLLLSMVSVIVSRETISNLHLFGLFKLFLMILLFSFISNYLWRTVSENMLSKVIQWSLWAVLASSAIQGFIAIWQYFIQRSIGLRLLGEEFIRSFIPGIAKFEILGGQRWIFDRIFDVSHGTSILVRPYGTFPHPNVLAAFMVFSLIISMYLYYVSHGTWRRGVIVLALFIQITTIFISFSRVALAGFLISVVIWFILMRFMGNHLQPTLYQRGEEEGNSLRGKLSSWIVKMKQKIVKSIISRLLAVFRFSRDTLGIEGGKGEVIDHIDQEEIDKKRTLKKLAMAVIASMVIVGILFYPQLLERGVPVSVSSEINMTDETNQRAISDRLLYQEIAFEMIKAKPILGVGYKNFVLEMDNYTKEPLKSHQHQPVHNIYLLIGAETGITGLIVFLLFIGAILQSAWKSKLTTLSITFLSIFIGFLFIGLFDHYLWTIQQGQLMFFVVSGLLIGALKKH